MGLRTSYLRLTDEEILKIVKYIKENGDGDICDRCDLLNLSCESCPVKRKQITHVLIENFIPLALSLASKFTRLNNRDELISVSLYALVETVARIPKVDDISKFSAYVNSRIMFKLKQFILTDGVIQLKVNRVAGNENLRKTYPIKDYVTKYSSHLSLELRETIEAVIANETEETIISCIIMGGYTNNDIAEKCGKSASLISRIKYDLFQRLQDVL